MTGIDVIVVRLFNQSQGYSCLSDPLNIITSTYEPGTELYVCKNNIAYDYISVTNKTGGSQNCYLRNASSKYNSIGNGEYSGFGIYKIPGGIVNPPYVEFLAHTNSDSSRIFPRIYGTQVQAVINSPNYSLNVATALATLGTNTDIMFYQYSIAANTGGLWINSSSQSTTGTLTTGYPKTNTNSSFELCRLGEFGTNLKEYKFYAAGYYINRQLTQTERVNFTTQMRTLYP